MSLDFARVKTLFFDRATVMSAADKATIRALSKFGAFVRRRSRSSIKQAPKREKTAHKRGLIRDSGGIWISSPGNPPVSHTGVYRESIQFSYDPGARSVVIGPVAYRGSGKGAKALEEGGESERWGKPISIRARPAMRPAFLAELPGVPAEFKGGMQR